MRYRYSFTIWILILVGNILSGISSWAKSPIEFNAGFESVYLRSELEFLEDPSGSMTFERVLSAENQSRFNPTERRSLIREIPVRSIGCVSVLLIPPPIPFP